MISSTIRRAGGVFRISWVPFRENREPNSRKNISAGLLRGYDRNFAVRFSFLMSLPAVLGANILTLKPAKLRLPPNNTTQKPQTSPYPPAN